VLDPDVVVEPLQVPYVRGGCGHRRVQVRGAVPGDGQLVRLRHRRSTEPLGVPAAPGGVHLQAVHGLGCAHPLEVAHVAAVLSGGDVRLHLLTHQVQTGEVVGADRFLQPGHAGLGGGTGQADRLLGGVGAVGVGEQLGLGPDGLPGPVDAVQVAVGAGAVVLPGLDLHPRDLLVRHPGDQLLDHPVVVVAGEAAAAVDLDLPTRKAEQVDQAHPEQAGIEVPQRHVHRGDRISGYPGTGDV